jgi:hypothetical protein
MAENSSTQPIDSLAHTTVSPHNDLGDARDLLGNFGEILGPDVSEVDPL